MDSEIEVVDVLNRANEMAESRPLIRSNSSVVYCFVDSTRHEPVVNESGGLTRCLNHFGPANPAVSAGPGPASLARTPSVATANSMETLRATIAKPLAALRAEAASSLARLRSRAASSLATLRATAARHISRRRARHARSRRASNQTGASAADPASSAASTRRRRASSQAVQLLVYTRTNAFDQDNPAARTTARRSARNNAPAAVSGAKFESVDCPQASVIHAAVNAEMMSDPSTCDCSVCLETFELDEAIRKTRCNHFFHGECISTWVAKVRCCPICRQPL